MRDLSNDKSLVSLNTATVREQWDLRQMIEGCVRHGIGGISPWRDKLQECGVTEAAKMLGDTDLSVTGLCRGGMFTAADEAGRQVTLDDNRRAVDEAIGIGAQCLVLVVGGMPEGSRDIEDARQQVQDGIGALLEYSRPAGIPLAIEPLHPMYAADRACVNTMAQANDICDALGDDGLGIALDVYHVWWDPDLASEITRAGKKRILAFHVCDWLVPTVDLLLDRGMPGDGVIDIRGIRGLVEGVGYDGHCEVEILSNRWWAEDPDAIMETLIERHQSVV